MNITISEQGDITRIIFHDNESINEFVRSMVKHVGPKKFSKIILSDFDINFGAKFEINDYNRYIKPHI